MAARSDQERAISWEEAARVATALGERRSATSLAQRGLDDVVRFLRADAGALFRHENDRLTLLRQHGFSLGFDAELQTLALDHASITTSAARQGDLQVVDLRDASHRWPGGLAEIGYAQKLATLVAVSLNAHDCLCGVLTLGFRALRRFDASERAIISFLAHSFGLAINVSTTVETVRRMDETFRAVDEATLAIAAEHEPRRVLQAILERARTVAGARYAALGIGKHPNRPFEPWLHSGMDEEQVRLIGPFPRPVGLLGAVPAEGGAIRIPDLNADPRFHGWPANHPRMTSFLGVPILLRGEPIGNLYLTDKIGAAEFSAEDERAVSVLAAHAAIAFRHAQLFEQAQAERNRLEALVENSPMGIFFVERDSGFTYLNRAAEDLFGHRNIATEGRTQWRGRLLSPDGLPISTDDLPSSRALRGEQVIGTEVILRRRDGREVPLLVNAAPIHDGQGRVSAAAVLLQDITPLKLERLREEFISVIAHELRTPITVIMGFADLLSRQRAEVPVQAAIDSIRISARRLDRMVSDLLDASRLEARRLPIEPQVIHLDRLIEGLMERLREVLGDHPVSLAASRPTPEVAADPTRIEQVVTNLLTNAAKYSPPGTPIRIAIHSDADASEVVVSVTNEGPGIGADDIPRLFTRFHRSTAARQRGTPGIGIGLYLARGLVEAHGGRIWATSEPGKETTFAFALPSHN